MDTAYSPRDTRQENQYFVDDLVEAIDRPPLAAQGWAKLEATAASTLRTCGLATQHRGDAPNPLQWLPTSRRSSPPWRTGATATHPSNKLLR